MSLRAARISVIPGEYVADCITCGGRGFFQVACRRVRCCECGGRGFFHLPVAGVTYSPRPTGAGEEVKKTKFAHALTILGTLLVLGCAGETATTLDAGALPDGGGAIRGPVGADAAPDAVLVVADAMPAIDLAVSQIDLAPARMDAGAVLPEVAQDAQVSTLGDAGWPTCPNLDGGYRGSACSINPSTGLYTRPVTVLGVDYVCKVSTPAVGVGCLRVLDCDAGCGSAGSFYVASCSECPL
jgi:hypothetical protein